MIWLIKRKRKVKKIVNEGIAHVNASFNNTIVTITDKQGNTLSLATSEVQGLEIQKKPFAAQVAVDSRAKQQSLD